MKSILLALAAASVANAYYYTVDVMTSDQGKRMACVQVETFDFWYSDPSTGKRWDRIGSTCINQWEGSAFSWHNSDWRLNQFYNVTIQPGKLDNDVVSLTTIEDGGIVIPCTLMDEYHEVWNNPYVDDAQEFPNGFQNHWQFVCFDKRIFRDVGASLPTTVATSTTTSSATTTATITASTTTTTTTTTPSASPTTTKTTTTTTKTTTKTPTPTCIAGYKGKLNGQGPNGACCSSSDDCKETCVKGICKLYT
ncbi:hypothetical protein BC940DRAFT_294307 [Gongronella butleri]|nr:hypothetical protein BC940DRAFT_294307 [Gongronella butleri]